MYIFLVAFETVEKNNEIRFFNNDNTKYRYRFCFISQL